MNEHMNTRDRRIFEALDGIDEKYIAEVTERYEVFDPLASYAPTRRAKRRMYTRLAAFAACLVLVVLCLPALARVLQQYSIIGPGTDIPSTTVETPETPPPETVAPEVTDTPDTDEITPELTDWTVPPEEPGVFGSYESIIKLLENISNICFGSGNISGDRSKYEATLNFADEKEREWFGKIFDSAIDGRYGSELPYGYSIGDINGDGINELLFLREDYKLLTLFTLSEDSPELLDSFGYRRKGKIDTEGIVYTFENVFSETVPQYVIYKIAGGSLEMVDALGNYDVGETRFFYRIRNGERESVESQEYYDLAKKSPFKTEISIFNEDNPGVDYIGFDIEKMPETDPPKDPVDPDLKQIYEDVFAGRRYVFCPGDDNPLYLAECGDYRGVPVSEWKDNRIAYLDFNKDGPPEVLMLPKENNGAYIIYYNSSDDRVYAYFVSPDNGYSFYADASFGRPESSERMHVLRLIGAGPELYSVDHAELGITLNKDEPEWIDIEIAPVQKTNELKYMYSYDAIINIMEDISFIFDSGSLSYDRFLQYSEGFMFENVTERSWFTSLGQSAMRLNKAGCGYGYSIGDINGDGTDELVYLLRDHTVLAIFTMCEGQPRLLDAFWDRYRGYIDGEGRILTFGSDSAFGSSRIVYEISPNNRELDVIAELHINYNDSGEANIYCNFFDADEPSYITEEELKAIENADPFMKESDIKTEKNKGIRFVGFDYKQPAISKDEMIRIFEQVCAGERAVEFLWGSCYLPGYNNFAKRLWEYDDFEAAYIDFDGDGNTELLIRTEGDADFLLHYDPVTDSVCAFEFWHNYGYTYYANGEYYSAAEGRRCRIKKFNLSEAYETETVNTSGADNRLPVWSDIKISRPITVEKYPLTLSYSNYYDPYWSAGSFSFRLSDDSTSYLCFSSPYMELSSVRFYQLDPSNVEYELGKLLYSSDYLVRGKYFRACVKFYGDMTAYGFSFTDTSGKERYFAVYLSGADGSPVLTEFYPASVSGLREGTFTAADDVTQLGKDIFAGFNVNDIKELIIGANVKKIDLSYINRFENLKKISVHGDNKYFATRETEDGATVLISKYSNEMIFLPAENDYIDLGYRRSAVSNNYRQSTDIDMYVGGKEVTESELDNYKKTLQTPRAEFLPTEVEWQVKDVIWGG